MIETGIQCQDSSVNALAFGPGEVWTLPTANWPADVDFRDCRREAFVQWLTAPAHPLFARVAVNRLWGWYFGEGLQRVTSDFGLSEGEPSNHE